MSQVAATSPSANPSGPDLAFKPLSRHDVADILKVSVRTVENWRAQGLIAPGVTMGGRLYWHPDVFYASLAAKLRADASPEGVTPDPVEKPAIATKRALAATAALDKSRKRSAAAIAEITANL